jgi:hypothetical protein
LSNGSKALGFAAALAALSLAASPALAEHHADHSANNSCFLSSDWDGWKSPSPTVIYLRVGVNSIYRLDLASPSYELDDADVHLISKIRGSSWICAPVDLDLQLADDHGVLREPLFVKSITKLTPDEAKAIPAKFRP